MICQKYLLLSFDNVAHASPRGGPFKIHETLIDIFCHEFRAEVLFRAELLVWVQYQLGITVLQQVGGLCDHL